MKYTLYVGSSSSSRKILLELSKIPFTIVEQNADESLVSKEGCLTDVVKNIAQFKMKHVVLPDGKEQGEVCFALTADTLGLTKDGQKMGKPTSRQEAIQMLRNSRGGNICATGFCIRKLQWDGKVWNVLREVIDVVQTSYIMDVPEEFLDHYLDTIPYKQVSGAIGIELAPQYCKQVNGSYTAVVGLPVYEVRETLHQLGFYE